MLPAAGQAIGIECRADDEEMCAWLAAINHEDPAARCGSSGLHAGAGRICHSPVAALAEIMPDGVRLRRRYWRRRAERIAEIK